MYDDSSASKTRLNFFKLILLIAGIAVALYLALNRVKFQNKAAQYPATLVFTPSSATVAVGSTFQAPISLNTGGGTIRGVDVQLTFDKTKLLLTAITPNAASTTTLKTFAPVTVTNTFDTAKVISSANTNGTIEFGTVTADMTTSAVTAVYNGSTVLATLTFQALTSGSTSINFNPATVPVTNLTTDTNIVVDSNPPVDTLSSVTNLTVNITSTGPTPTTPIASVTPPASASPTLMPTWKKSDLNNDGTVNIFDYTIFVQNFGNITQGNVADINKDGTVNIFDYTFFIQDFGQHV